jgi:hypothetical protein
MYDFYNQQYPQLLAFAYNKFSRNKKIIFNAMEQKDSHILIDDGDFDNFAYLLKLFVKNPCANSLASEIKQGKLRVKDRIRLKLYKYLRKKLLQKDLV